MTGSSCPGAAFQRGRSGIASPWMRKREIRTSAGDVIQYRPHMSLFCGASAISHCLLSLLVRPHQHRLGENVALHRPLELRLRRLAEVGEGGVEGVEFEEVAVTANRGTGVAVPGSLPVVR